jgi:hypothetical protein
METLEVDIDIDARFKTMAESVFGSDMDEPDKKVPLDRLPGLIPNPFGSFSFESEEKVLAVEAEQRVGSFGTANVESSSLDLDLNSLGIPMFLPPP